MIYNTSIVDLHCIKCNKKYLFKPELMTCVTCGSEGILEVNFDIERVKARLNPATLADRAYDMWRYAELLPIVPQQREILPHLGFTPLYHLPSLRKYLGDIQIYVKDDTSFPTGSSKDRASAIAVLMAKALEKGTITCASTGNAASSLAGLSARVGLRSIIFIPERAPLPKTTQLLIYGAKVFKIRGDYSQAYALCQEAVAKYRWYNRSCAINPFLIEGKKTCGMEIAEQMGEQLIDWVVVPVGDGCTVAGIYKGLRQMYELGFIPAVPRILGVQAEGAQALYQAWTERGDLKQGEESTIADSIAVGYPRNWRKAMNAIRTSSGAMITVDDDEIGEALVNVPALSGMFIEPATSAGFAGTKKALERKIIDRQDNVVIVATGSGLKDINAASSVAGEPITILPKLENVTIW